jgi:hypothetical protein
MIMTIIVKMVMQITEGSRGANENTSDSNHKGKHRRKNKKDLRVAI